MPNIAARSNLPAAPAAPAADLSSPASRAVSRRGSRAERGTTFDEVLSGARRRDPAPAADAEPKPVESKDGAPEQAPRAEGAEPTTKSKPAKSKPRADAERDTGETAETEQTPDDGPAAAAAASASATGSDVETTDGVDDGGSASAPAAEDDAPATVQHSDANAGEAVNSNLALAEQLPGADLVVGSVPEIAPAAPDQTDELPANASVTEGTTKPAPEAAVLDAKDVRGDQPTPVLLGEIAQAQQVSPTAAVVGGTPPTDSSATAEHSTATLPGVTPSLGHNSPAAPAGTEHVTRTPHLDQPAPEGTAPADPPAASKSAAAVSNEADVVHALDASEESAAAPAAAPAVATQAAPDPASTVTASMRALEALAGQNVHESAAPKLAPDAPQLPPEVQFAEDNHPNIVAGVRGQLLPTGGTMQIRLDPPELGPLAVTIRLNDGVMEASFETSNDQAAKLLSHSLSALKTSLEAQGVTVDRLHVQQAPKSEQASQQGGNGDSRDQQQNGSRDPQQDHAARQEHQRKEMLRRMWAKLRGTEDPLDMVA